MSEIIAFENIEDLIMKMIDVANYNIKFINEY